LKKGDRRLADFDEPEDPPISTPKPKTENQKYIESQDWKRFAGHPFQFLKSLSKEQKEILEN